MNTDGNGKRLLDHHIPHLRLNFRPFDPAPAGESPERAVGQGDSARRSGASEGGGFLWKIIAADSQPGRARGLLRAWPGWEYVSQQLWPAIDVPDAPHGLVRVRITRYRGEPLALPDGAVVQHNAIVGELHCNNQALLQLIRKRGNPWTACREDLRGLARWIEADEQGRQAVAFHAVTILAKGSTRLGFTIVKRPITLRRRFEKIFFTGLLLLYSEQGLNRLGYGSTPRAYPQETWISRHKLIRMYGGSRDADSRRQRIADRMRRVRSSDIHPH